MPGASLQKQGAPAEAESQFHGGVRRARIEMRRRGRASATVGGVIARATLLGCSAFILAALAASACSEGAMGTPEVPTSPTASASAPPTASVKPTATAIATPTATATALDPPPVPVPIKDATDVGAGSKHACAMLEGGKVACWGKNDRGQLGNGSTADSAIAGEVAGVLGAQELAVAGDLACVRIGGGNVACWGAGVATATRVPGITTAASLAIAEGTSPCAVLDDGTARCWTMADLAKPSAEPVAGLHDVVQLATGRDHSCALLKSGKIVCWGDNCTGQIGDGTRKDRGAPTPVAGIPRAVAVAVSAGKTCAILPNHAVACWGSQGLTCPAPSKPDVCVQKDADPPGCGQVAGLKPRVFHGIVHVTSFGKGRLGCGLIEDAGVSCWDRSDRAPAFPGEAQPVAGLAGATSLAVGDKHACAVLADHSVMCWGDGDAGQLGNGVAGPTRPAPGPVLRAP
jgi:Regulator of chromosome condensation (RCC1) repeat